MINLHSAGRWEDLPSDSFDVCIVGTGPAGSTIARELSGTPLRVVVLESGGVERLPDADALDRSENVGRPRSEPWAVRNRILGGSSHTWGGRCAPFDAIDFEERDWVPHSGWPFPRSTLDPYLERTAAYLGLSRGNHFSDERFWQMLGTRPSGPEPDPNLLLPFFWQFSRDDAESYPFEYMRFGRKLRERLGANVTLVCGATAVAIEVSEAGDVVRGVEVASPDGVRRRLSAGAVVLCTGGIENARLLLASNGQGPAGLGNRHDLVGRYLMDHLRGPVGFLDPRRTHRLQRRFGRYTVDRRLFRGGLRLNPDVQRSRRLLNCAVWLGETLHPRDPIEAIRRVVAGKPRWNDLPTLGANLPLLLRGIRDVLVYRNGLPRRLAELTLECMVEQRPDPDSRVTLSDQRDPLGGFLPRVDWRSHEDEGRTMRDTARLAAAEFARLGMADLTLADWVLKDEPVPTGFTDVAHPTGTTRMAASPTRGVCDAEGQVHGVAGLYVAGSSVFPTAGHCNPTQTIVALAIRQADTIKARARRASVATRQSVGAPDGPPRVLVTGATGRIGRVLVEDLLDRGYRCRATTSQALGGDRDASGDVEWRRFDFMVDQDYDALVDGCDAVLHLAAELGNQARMPTVNAEAPARLAQAAERKGVRAFCYVSTVSVYGSGLSRDMSETAPVLDSGRDVKSQYWALDYVRAYGRTKLAGEHAITRIARTLPYVILRPTVVVDTHHLTGLRDWSLSKRLFAAHRHANHVYVRDVTDAVIWAMRQMLAGTWSPGSVQVFNLSEQETSDARIGDFMRKAFAIIGDKRFKVFPVPAAFDWLRDFARHRTLPLRNPLWRMRFPNDRLLEAGYRHRYGMVRAREQALDELRSEVRDQRAGASP